MKFAHVFVQILALIRFSFGYLTYYIPIFEFHAADAHLVFLVHVRMHMHTWAQPGDAIYILAYIFAPFLDLQITTTLCSNVP